MSQQGAALQSYNNELVKCKYSLLIYLHRLANNVATCQQQIIRLGTDGLHQTDWDFAERETFN